MVSIQVKPKTFVLIGLLLASSLFLSQASSARAYTIENFNDEVEGKFIISPVMQEISVVPGEKKTIEMLVVNRLCRSAEFLIQKEDVLGSKDPDKSATFLGDESSGITSAKDWVTPELSEISLNQGDRLTMSLTLTTPTWAKPGSHYVAMFASVGGAEARNQDEASKVKLVSRLGLVLLINVTGEPGSIKEAGEITEFLTDKSFYDKSPIEFATVFKNTGNVYQKINGSIQIKNMLGVKVDELPLQKDWIVLSDSSKRQKVTWNKDWLLGKYTAHITMNYGPNDSLKAEKDLTFYVIQWKLIALGLLALVILFVVLRTIKGMFSITVKKKTRK
jgi:hypothetical protein